MRWKNVCKLQAFNSLSSTTAHHTMYMYYTRVYIDVTSNMRAFQKYKNRTQFYNQPTNESKKEPPN